MEREFAERRPETVAALSRRRGHEHGELIGRQHPGKPGRFSNERTRRHRRLAATGSVRAREKLPVEVRKQFVSLMEPWTTENKVLYNPKERFIDYVVPGIIGLILQLLTVTLMAGTIARERESGTLYQLMVTSLQRREIVIGKILPHLAVSILVIVIIVALSWWHFEVRFYQWHMLALICLLFLLCSLGLGLLISAFSRTQTQAIQFSVFFLLPVFVLSGAFAPLEQLPQAIRYISAIFPLTHFCRAFRLVNMYHASAAFYAVDLLVLLAGAVVTFVGAAFLLRRTEQ